jgi:hypothetical protein
MLGARATPEGDVSGDSRGHKMAAAGDSNEMTDNVPPPPEAQARRSEYLGARAQPPRELLGRDFGWER